MDPDDPTQQPANPLAPTLQFGADPAPDPVRVVTGEDFVDGVGEPPD